MAGRRSLHAVVLFAVILHAIAISQTFCRRRMGSSSSGSPASFRRIPGPTSCAGRMSTRSTLP